MPRVAATWIACEIWYPSTNRFKATDGFMSGCSIWLPSSIPRGGPISFVSSFVRVRS